jgi:membrane protein YqaA with SNARE-associated domain
MGWWKLAMVPALAKLGLWGLVLMSLLDSSSVPLLMDPIVAGYIWANQSRLLLVVVLASLASAVGGLVPYLLGRAGGELFLLRRINREKFEKIRAHFERQEFLAMLIPSILPPPTPWKAFVFAAGVFEMRSTLFLLAVFLGRFLRWLALGLLVIHYGPQIVDAAAHTIAQHKGILFVALAVLFAMILFSVFRRRNKPEEQ